MGILTIARTVCNCGFDLDTLLLFVLLGEIQDEGAAEGGEVAVEGLGGVSGDEEEGAVVVGLFPGVFDGGGSCRHRPCLG